MIGMTHTTLEAMRNLARMAEARRLSSDRGATAVEYGLIVALIAAVIVATVAVLGGDVNDAFTTVETEIDGTVGG